MYRSDLNFLGKILVILFMNKIHILLTCYDFQPKMPKYYSSVVET